MHTSTVSIGLINPKTPTNMGAVMRASGCYQVDSVFYTGERYDRAEKFYTDTQNVNQSIPLVAVPNLLEAISNDQMLVCVELVEGAIPLPEYKHPQNAFYVFGPEDGSINQKMIDRADAVVYVPTIGCMNLAATVNVVLYDRMAKSSSVVVGDELIRSSRDRNNRVKVKAKVIGGANK